jgi:hypothetical protein
MFDIGFPRVFIEFIDSFWIWVSFVKGAKQKQEGKDSDQSCPKQQFPKPGSIWAGIGRQDVPIRERRLGRVWRLSSCGKRQFLAGPANGIAGAFLAPSNLSQEQARPAERGLVDLRRHEDDGLIQAAESFDEFRWGLQVWFLVFLKMILLRHSRIDYLLVSAHKRFTVRRNLSFVHRAATDPGRCEALI